MPPSSRPMAPPAPAMPAHTPSARLRGTPAGNVVAINARAVGAALAAPTALALIATTFPAGVPRNRALGVWAGMAGAGGAIGLLLGGILTTYVSWRWVLFVNAPLGLLVAALAP